MAYTVDTTITLGSSQTGLALAAQLIDSTGTQTTGFLTTGFVELGGGMYLWHYTDYPTGFRGCVTFTLASDSNHLPLAVADINPEPYENGTPIGIQIGLSAGPSVTPGIIEA